MNRISHKLQTSSLLLVLLFAIFSLRTLHAGDPSEGLNLDEFVGLGVEPDDENEVTLQRTGPPQGCNTVTLAIEVTGEVEANGGTEGWYDEVSIGTPDGEEVLFGGDASDEETWSLTDDFVGVEKTATVQVTLSIGEAIHLYYRTRNDYWNDGWGAEITNVEIVPSGCDDCGGGGVGNDCVSMIVGLGSTPVGDIVPGALTLKGTTPSPLLYTPSALTLGSAMFQRTKAERDLAGGTLPNMVVIASNGGLWSPGDIIRQVISLDLFADIVPEESQSKYEIRIYKRDQVGPRDSNGFFTVAGSAQPYEVWTVENPDPASVPTDRFVKITQNKRGELRVNNFEWVAADNNWTLLRGEGPGAIRERRITTTNGAATEERLIVSDIPVGGIEKIAHEEREIKTNFSFGTYVTLRSIGSGADEQIAIYEYWPDGKLKKTIHPTGKWEYFHSYDSEGRVTQKVEQYGDNPFTGSWPDSVNKSIQNTYTTTTTSRRTEKLVKLKGVNATREWTHRYFPRDLRTNPADVMAHNYVLKSLATDMSVTSYQHASNLTTTTYYYQKGAVLPGRERMPSRIIRPGGDLTLYEYDKTAEGGWITKETSGGANPDSTAVIKGYSTITAKNPQDEIVAYSKYFIEAGQNPILLESYEAIQVDDEGRPVAIVYSDGTTVTRSYGCCGLQTETGRDGMRTVFAYDMHGRLRIKEIWAGSTKRSAEHYDLDAQGRVLQTNFFDASGNVARPPEISMYDTSGRLLFTSKGGIENTYTYENNGLRKTRTGPAGIAEITERAGDGTNKKREGPSTTGEYYTRGVITATGFEKGYEWEEVHFASATSPRWRKTIKNRQGRAVREETPDFNGAVAAKTFDYNAKGLLSKRSEPGLAPYLFRYDELGRLLAEGYDLNGDNQLTPASTDSILETAYSYQQESGVWYEVVARNTYVTNGAADSVPVGATKRRVSGLSLGTTAETVSEDSSGQRTVTSESLDPVTRTRTVTVDLPDSTRDSVGIYVEGRLQSQTSGHHDGVITYIYDTAGRLEQEVDDRNNVPTLTTYHPVFGTPLTITRGSRQKSYTYYESDHINAGQVKTENDNGRVIRYRYNARGQRTHQWGGTYPIQMEYDQYGQLHEMHTYRFAAQDDPFTGVEWPAVTGGDTTVWAYKESTGQLVSKTDASGGAVSYAYYPSGKLNTRTWARGVVTTYTYGPTGALTNTTYSDGTAAIVQSLDRRGRPFQTDHGDQSVTRTYAPHGPLLAEQTTGSDFKNVVTVDYDTFGRRQHIHAEATQDQLVVEKTYSYDTYGRLSMITDGSTATKIEFEYIAKTDRIGTRKFYRNNNLVMTSATEINDEGDVWEVATRRADASLLVGTTYALDARGRRERATRENGSYWHFGYNTRDEVTSGEKRFATGDVYSGSDYGYQFDSIGNRTVAVEAGHSGSYSGNALNQLTERQVPGSVPIRGEALESAYVTINDGPSLRQGKYFYRDLLIDNSTSAVSTNVLVSAVLRQVGLNGEDVVDEKAGRVVTAKTPQGSSYDNDGNLTNDGLWLYGWNGENRLIAIEGVPGSPNAGAGLAFSYDDLGRRVLKSSTRVVNGTPETSMSRFIWDELNPLAEMDSTVSMARRRFMWGPDLSGSEGGAGGVGGLLAVYKQNSCYFPAYDGNGNVLATVDAGTSAVAEEFEYGPFGEVFRATHSSVDAICPFRFSTKWEDTESGLYYYGHRYYNPKGGRWISRDPVSEKGGASLYGFVQNRATGLIDPNGLTFETNWEFFWDWVLEHGSDDKREYGEGTVELEEMEDSPGADKMRKDFLNGNCKTIAGGSWGGGGFSGQVTAYFTTVYTPNSTAFQVGGFLYDAENNDDGTVTYTIHNQASAYSFFLHIDAIPHKPRGGTLKLFGNIDQEFTWTEENPCCE